MSAARHVPIRLGQVGGGVGAFIGDVHRIASRIDGDFTLVAGALSSTAAKAEESAAALGIAPDRTYSDWAEMAKAEAAREDGIEAVAICTPNHLHVPVAKAFLAEGIHVICDKPLAASLDEARELQAVADASDAAFVLTHNYSGYPLVREAKAMVARGDLGQLRVVQVEYPQDWMTDAVEKQGVKQAEWRSDPERAGLGGATGDIGTHAYHLARFVSGLRLERLAADLSAFVPGRVLDDNAHVMLRFEGGVKGMLWCSQIAPGHENGLRLRIFGDKGGIEWFQEEPNVLWHTTHGEPPRRLTRGGPGTNGGGTRIPPGHPEGYLEGFATIYADAARLIRARQAGEEPPEGLDLPDIRDGVEGVAFVAACVRSSGRDAAWVELDR
ncbi:Gfo/Idh/MocA family oxidoreductase [Palleronia sp. LCG004]|uniref:Gfo/Idh/MocA family protein n=1 Tax=Palleronia sp. LCG004 TaxID=3079304 RepID=UPI002942DBB8|nr:Gfo/Idh/MocA family oxidoreductase [Palleronia sp. LCG004]WOI58178.1 Gfo/Idh/MocA family oxidoreductase [Palleronia sp. LCG004]